MFSLYVKLDHSEGEIQRADPRLFPSDNWSLTEREPLKAGLWRALHHGHSPLNMAALKADKERWIVEIWAK